MDNYTVYHLHSDYSLLDSTTKYNQYIDRAKEFGMKAIGFSEHGNIFNWVKKKQYCDKVGIKYMHGSEIYLTEDINGKLRDNYHTILYCKNYEGVLELNKLISLSNQKDHFYYKPRISFDEFLSVSDNIISISACLASPLSKISQDNPYYDKLVGKYDYLEIQPHYKSQDQIEYNNHIYNLSIKHNKKIIIGTDTHEINAYKQECRSILKKAKGMSYDNEDDFDLTFRSYDNLILECNKQNCFSMSIYEEAINNTNELADSVSSFELDTSFKYPVLYANEEVEYKNKIRYYLDDKIDSGVINKNRIGEYKKKLNDEFMAFKNQGMFSYMLFISELSNWCWENDIPIGYGRGSCTGSLSAYILNVTDVDPIVWNTIFSRFVNSERVSLADIDLDFAPEDREKVFNYIIDRFGVRNTSYIITFNSISEKGTISEITRALKYDFNKGMDIKREFEEDEEICRGKYPEIFYFFDGLMGTYISAGIHPCGIVSSPITLDDTIGVYYNDGNAVSQCDMKSIDSLNYVKFDILGLKNIGIIKETYKLINQKYKKAHEIDWDDKNVWDDITSSQVGIFQFESDYAFSLLKQFKPRKINDISLINASLRPSGESYRENILKREFHHNATPEIDELLKDNYGYLVYQEDQIKFLQEICGLSGGRADTVRRAIGKKLKDLLDEMIPEVREGYISKSNRNRAQAEIEVQEFLTILQDSSDYAFGFNHSTSYSMIGYTCAYLRHYHPIEFMVAFLNRSQNDDDLKNGFELSKLKNIEIKPITFGDSIHNYSTNGTEIYKGMESIKFINKTIPYELNQLKDSDDFIQLIESIKNDTSVNSRQLNVLIKLDYFNKFAGIDKLMKFNESYNLLDKKQFRKEKLLPELEVFVKKYSEDTGKQYKLNDRCLLLNDVWNSIPDDEISFKDRVRYELEFLNYIKTDIPEGEKIGVVLYNKKDKKGTCLQSLRNGNKIWFNLAKGVKLPKKGSTLYLKSISRSKTKYRDNFILEDYEVLKEG